MAGKTVMADVARRAGVSLQTVSRVIHNHRAVSPTTRARVQEAITALDYHPDIAAQRLASGSSRSFGVVTVGKLHHGMRSTFSEIEAHARADGYFVLSASAPPQDLEALSDALSYVNGQRVLASVIIVQDPACLPLLSRLVSGRGVLVMSGGHRLDGFTTVSFDQAQGARLATQHLLDHCQAASLVHVAGPLDSQDSLDRIGAFEACARAAGAAGRWFCAEGWSAWHGYQAGKKLLSQGVPEGIFASNDQLAIGIMRALFEAGARAGTDYRIVGFDDNPSSSFLQPSLSSVCQNYDLLASEIITALRAIVAGEPAPDVLIPTVLHPRES